MKHPYGSPGRTQDDAMAPGTKRANIMKIKPGEPERRAAPAADSELLLGLTGEESRKVIRQMEEKRFPRGATIFRKGDPGDSLFTLMEGLVKLVARSEKGAGTILYILRPADIFGELLLVEERRPFNAVAVTDVLAGVLSREHFADLLSSVPRLRLNFIRILSRRLVHVEKGVTEFSHTRSYDRLAKVLLQLCGEYGEETPWGVLLHLTLTHADLADLIGTTRETVTNQLSRFHRMGLVWAHGHHLVVNRRRLADYVRPEDIRRDEGRIALDKSA